VIERVSITCKKCKENGVRRNQRLLAQIWWIGDDRPIVRYYPQRLGKNKLGRAVPGQLASPNPLRITSRVGMVTADDDGPVTLRCHHCATQWPFKPSQLVRTAGPARKISTPEVELIGARKKSRPRRGDL